MYKNFFKRLFDFIIALIGLIVLSPIFILVTIGLYVANQGKPFFFQTRPGKDEKLFRIVKFKTMNEKKEVLGGDFLVKFTQIIDLLSIICVKNTIFITLTSAPDGN